MPLYQVAIIKKAGKKNDQPEEVVRDPEWILEGTPEAAKIAAIARELAAHPTLDVSRWEVLVQPFRS